MTSRALRIGIVIGGSLVEERVIDGSAPITLGQSLRCTLSIPVEGVPREHVLFTRDADTFVLHVAGEPARRLERGARGKLRIGEATVLYQEVPRAAPAPRPRLPASIRGTFADRIDRRLAVIVGGSLVVHVAIATWAWSTDREQPLLGEPPTSAEFERATIDVSDIIEPPVTPPAPAVAPPVAPPIQTPTRLVQPTRVVVPSHPDAPIRVDDAARFASILTSPDAGETGIGSMERRHPGADLDKQLDDARHHRVTIGDGTPTSRDPRFTIGDHQDRELPLGDPTFERPPAPTDPGEHRPRIRPFDPKADERTSLTPDAVIAKINALYMSGLERCYRKGLTDDANLGGRVSISFTVDEAGRVIDPDASGVETRVDHCISSQMSSWRFAIPRDGKGEPTETTFHVTLALQRG